MIRVAVLGAGVVGMTTALQLVNDSKLSSHICVTIIADKFGQDTTSDGAAGIFRPGTSFSGPSPQVTRQWLVDSYKFYSALLDSNAGVSPASGFIFSSTSPSLVRNHLLEGLVPVYRPATETELASCPGDWKYGSYFETLVIECRHYLPWALDKIKLAGGKVKQRRVESFAELEEEFDVVFNCTGLGAKALTGDYKMVPIRGQVFKVEAPWVKHFYYADYDTYVIPQSGGIVTLGGSRHYDSHHTSPCRHDLAAIRERCENLVPSLRDAKVLSTWAGLRPHRDTVRVERERVGRLTVVHNYGHGGYGVTTAPGTAKYAVDLFREVVLRKSKL